MKHVALLRGINIGGRNKVAMPILKNLFERAGFLNVQTYINSGNVIFDLPENQNDEQWPEKIEKIIEQEFGFSVPVVVRSAKNLQNVLSACDAEWQNSPEEKTNIMFLWPEADDENILNQLESTDKDIVRYADGAVIWHTWQADFNKSGLAKLAKNPLYKKMTIRNINTLRKLAELTS